MPFSQNNIGTNTSTSGASVAVTVGAAGVPAGSLIVVAVTEKSTGGAAGTLADTATNTWNTSQSGSLAATAADGFGMVFFAFNSKGLANGNTITYTKATSGTVAAISACYFTGVQGAANPEITGARATANGTTGTITVTSGSAAGLFVGVLCDSGTTTAGATATFTQAANWATPPNEANSGASAGARVNGGWKLVATAATQTYNPTLSSTAQQWVLFVTAFNLVPDAGPRYVFQTKELPPAETNLWLGSPVGTSLSLVESLVTHNPRLVFLGKEALVPYETNLWQSGPVANYTTLGIPNPTIQSPFYAPRPHTDTDYWQTSSIADNTLRLLTEGGQPPQKVWHYDLVPDPVWQGSPFADTALFNITPTNKFWRYDLVPEPVWTWVAPPSDTIRLSTEGGQPPTKFWRYDADFNTFWVGAPQPKPPFLAGQVPTKQWRYDIEQVFPWQYPLARNNSTLSATTNFVQGETEEFYPDYSSYVWQYPFHLNTSLYLVQTNTVQSPFYAPKPPPDQQWQWEAPFNPNTVPPAHNPFIPPPLGSEQYFVEQPGWEFSSQPQPLAFTLLQLYAPLPPEAYYYDNSADVWRFTIQQNNLLNPPALLAPVHSPFYASRPPPDQNWQWTPPFTLTNESQAQTNPFFKLWRYDFVEQPQWAGAPNNTSINVPATSPVFKLWRYDYDSGQAVWTWAAPPSDTIRELSQATPFHKLWRYDYQVEFPQFQGSPISAFNSLNLTQIEPKNKQLWRYDYNSAETYWQAYPLGTNFLSLPKTVFPTAKPNDLDKDFIPEPPWVWNAIYERNLQLLPVGNPLGFGKRRPLFLQGLNNFPASYWPNGTQTTITTPTGTIPVNAYVTEDGTTIYVAEDGSTFYVQEN